MEAVYDDLNRIDEGWAQSANDSGLTRRELEEYRHRMGAIVATVGRARTYGFDLPMAVAEADRRVASAINEIEAVLVAESELSRLESDPMLWHELQERCEAATAHLPVRRVAVAVPLMRRFERLSLAHSRTAQGADEVRVLLTRADLGEDDFNAATAAWRAAVDAAAPYPALRSRLDRQCTDDICAISQFAPYVALHGKPADASQVATMLEAAGANLRAVRVFIQKLQQYSARNSHLAPPISFLDDAAGRASLHHLITNEMKVLFEAELPLARTQLTRAAELAWRQQIGLANDPGPLARLVLAWEKWEAAP